MTARWLVLALGGGLLAWLLVRATPKPPRPAPVELAADFTAAQQARCAAYAQPARRLALSRLVVSTVWALGMGLTPWGAWWVAAVADPFGGGAAAQLVLGVGTLVLAGRLLTLPLAGAGHRLRRRVGLATDSRRAWALDLLKAALLSLGLLLAVAAGLLLLASWAPQRWWCIGAILAAILVVAGSLLLPVLVEPLFSRFTALPAGPERTELLELAGRARLRVADVLVADASRRTTAFNAYVSGLGPTRRIVVYDTLLSGARFEHTRLVVAHELGHVARRDVLWGTAVGAAGAALATVGLSIALSWPWLLTRAGTDQVAEPTTVPLVLALATLGGLLGAPLQAALSRRVEARADRYALDLAALTGEPAQVGLGYAAMHRDLAVAGRADLAPARWLYLMFASHPSAPERIAAARSWAAERGAEVPRLAGSP